ncbi:hypothetical protein CZ771_13520 [Actinomycetales bacterium JB111]|nr:hypothetical protein CZ771_13520 [Actinomycetales bacterium JB111]
MSAPTKYSNEPQWAKVAVWTTAVQALFAGFLLFGAAVVVAIVLGLVNRFGTVDMSFAQFAVQIAVWLSFAVAISSVYTQANVFIANGATRRNIAIGQIVSAPVTGLVWAAACVLLVRIEGLVFDGYGWTHATNTTNDGVAQPADWDRGWWVYLALLTIHLMCAQLGGTVTGIAFYRFTGSDWYIPIALLIVTAAVPVLVVAGVFNLSSYGDLHRWIHMPIGVGLGISALIAAYLCVLAWLWFRRIPVRPKVA